MADIYSFANATDIWLGPESDDSALAIEFLLELKEILPSISETRHPNSLPLEIVVERKTAETGGKKWAAVNKLLNRPWFSRVWVLQEVALASGFVQFICGDHGISWRDFMDVMKNLHRLNSTSLICSVPPGEIDAMTIATFPRGWTQMHLIMMLADKRSNMTLSLEESIQLAQTCQATDPRDKLYGLYGLANVTDSEIAADYSKSVEYIYLQVTSYIMTTNESLRLLSDAGIAWEDRISSLPTWIPNYNIFQRPSVRLGSPVPNGYKASGNSNPDFHWDSLSNDLIVRGILADTVSKLSSCCPHHEKRPRFFFRDYLCEILELLEESKLNPDDPIVRECLWRTLLRDRDGEGRILSAEYGEWFDSFVRYHTELETFAEGFPWDELNTTDPVMAEKIKISLQQSHYKDGTHESLTNRRLCITHGGRMGLVPGKTIVGDTVSVLLGTEVPFILRKTSSTRGERRRFLLVGESYIHGLMNSEALELGRDHKITIQ